VSRPAPVRLVAAETLAAVLHEGRSLRELLPEADARLADPRDRALLRALLRAALRQSFRARALLGALMARPLPARARVLECLIRVGLAQIDAGIGPDYAAVSGAVDAAKASRDAAKAGLVNAVLRRYLRERAALEAALPGDDLELNYNHPRWLIERLREDWPVEWQAILAGDDRQAPIWLRVRHGAPGRERYRAGLAAEGIASTPHPELADALRLDESSDPGRLPGIAQGEVAVQDAAAQLAPELLALAPGLRVLDACAAPGGKLLHLFEREPALVVTAVERDAGRCARLGATLARAGRTVALHCADASEPDAWWDGTPFDRILIDAPCSATGVIRRHPEIRVLRRQADIAPAVALQARLLDRLWPMLAPGGRLVYATCSVLRDENDRQIAAFRSRSASAQSRAIVPDWFGLALPDGRQNLPGEDDMDGFYYAVLEKPA